MFVETLSELIAMLIVLNVILLFISLIITDKISKLERIAKVHDCNFYILHDNDNMGCKYQLQTEYEWEKGDGKIIGRRMLK